MYKSDLEKRVRALAGWTPAAVRRLQLIQNAAARVVTRTKKYQYVTPVLRSLHWLPVSHRINFKILLLVHKSLDGLAARYFSDLLLRYEPAELSGQLVLDYWMFTESNPNVAALLFYAPHIWNQLGEELSLEPMLTTFKFVFFRITFIY